MKGSGTSALRAKRGWMARRAASSIAVAVVVVVVGSRVNPAESRAGADAELEAILRRRISHADVDVRSLPRAAESLGRAAGVSIVVDPMWPHGRGDERARDDDRTAPLRVVDRPLGWALARVLGQFDPSSEELFSYEVREGQIRIGFRELLDNRNEVRAYEVQDLLGVQREDGMQGGCLGFSGAAATKTRQQASDAVIALLGELIMPTKWISAGGNPGMGFRGIGNYIVVTAPPQVQRDVARALFLLRHPTVPGRAAEGVAR